MNLRKSILTVAVLLSAFFLITSCSMSMKEGRAWLDTYKDPPALDVTGTWTCREFSVAQLTQVGREINGAFYGGGLISGVASGNSIHLLIYDIDTVLYMATLETADRSTMNGEYVGANGLLDTWAEGIRRPLSMVKLP